MRPEPHEGALRWEAWRDSVTRSLPRCVPAASLAVGGLDSVLRQAHLGASHLSEGVWGH